MSLYFWILLRDFAFFLFYFRTFCEEQLHIMPEAQYIFTPWCYTQALLAMQRAKKGRKAFNMGSGCPEARSSWSNWSTNWTSREERGEAAEACPTHLASKLHTPFFISLAEDLLIISRYELNKSEKAEKQQLSACASKSQIHFLHLHRSVIKNALFKTQYT